MSATSRLYDKRLAVRYSISPSPMIGLEANFVAQGIRARNSLEHATNQECPACRGCGQRKITQHEHRNPNTNGKEYTLTAACADEEPIKFGAKVCPDGHIFTGVIEPSAVTEIPMKSVVGDAVEPQVKAWLGESDQFGKPFPPAPIPSDKPDMPDAGSW